MSNRGELLAARRAAEAAVYALDRIEALPRRRGSRVLWSNGVLWTRAGDNDWRPDGDPDASYSSEHVATSAGTRSPWTVARLTKGV